MTAAMSNQPDASIPFTPGQKLESLQVVRALAAAMVVLFHASHLAKAAGTSDWKFHLGAFGVDLFFVLSGVIMALVPKRSPRDFLRRRLLRVVPLYFAVTLIAWPMALDAGSTNAFVSFTFWPALSRMTQPILGVGWTLSFELLFYLAVGLALGHRSRAFLLVGLWLAMMIAIPSGWTTAQFLGNPIIAEFLAGMGIATLWKRGIRLPLPLALALVTAGLLAWLSLDHVEDLTEAADTMNGSIAFARTAVVGGPAALIVMGFLNLDLRWPRFLVTMGDASYSTYLAHAAILLPLGSIVLPTLLQPFSLGIYLALCAAASFACYVLLERPLQQRLARRRQSPAEPSVSAIVPA